jgi:hypothetical protein
MMGLALISVLAIGIHSMSSLQNTSSKNRESATRALLLAEAGAAHAQAMVRDTLRMHDYTRLFRGSDNIAGNADDGVLDGYGMSSTLAIPKAGKVAVGGIYTVEIIDDPADPVASLLVDGNARAVLRCTGITSDSARASVDVIVGSMLVPGIATDKDLEISAAATINGACGGIHANGNLTGGGSPTVATRATATGTVSLDVTPKLSGQLPVEIPDLNPMDFCAGADYTITGNFVLSSGTPPGTYCVNGNVSSGGDFGSLASMKAISIFATGAIKINHKVFIKADHADGITLLGAGDLDYQADGGTEGMVYAGGHCYLSAKPTFNGQLICKSKADPAGAIDYTDKNLISGDVTINFGCYSLLNSRRRTGWLQRLGA